MNYLGFFSLGVGILTLVISLILLAISLFSHETVIKQKCSRLSIFILPVSIFLLITGFSLTFSILFPTDEFA